MLSQSQVNQRQVSRGTIWTVGGLAPSGNPVDDGHGHFVRSGTNAQFYTTPFSRSKTGPQDDTDRYHGRIASALDIDRVRRVLDFDTHATLPSARPQKGRHQRKSVKTIWDGVEWVNDDKEGQGSALNKYSHELADGQ